LGFGGSRRTLDEGLRQRPLAGKSETLEQDIRRVPTTASGNFASPPASRWLNMPRAAGRHYAAAGASPETVEEAKHLFDPNAY
jgi:hypothetical protein